MERAVRKTGENPFLRGSIQKRLKDEDDETTA